MQKALIDTDVVLDFFFDRQPFSEDAAKLFSLCEQKKIEGYVTPVICSNVYYLLRQTANHKKVIDKIRQLMNIMEVLNMNRDTVIHALGSNFNDFEDALQHYSAVQADFIDVILTRNVKDFVKSDIGVLTPEGFLKIM